MSLIYFGPPFSGPAFSVNPSVLLCDLWFYNISHPAKPNRKRKETPLYSLSLYPRRMARLSWPGSLVAYT